MTEYHYVWNVVMAEYHNVWNVVMAEYHSVWNVAMVEYYSIELNDTKVFITRKCVPELVLLTSIVAS